jgi:hypothetical protein
MCALNGVVSIRLYLPESERSIQSPGRFHRGERVQTHALITNPTGSADAQTSELWSGIQSFHLADTRTKLPEGHATSHLALAQGKEKAAVRWSIFAWQAGQLFSKPLKIQIYGQRVSIFLKKVSDFNKMFSPFVFHDSKQVQNYSSNGPVSGEAILDWEKDC